MADEDTRDLFKRAQSVSLDDALEVGAGHIRQSRRKVGENNPNFIAQHVQCKLQEYTLVVCGGPRTGKSTLINAILNKKLAPVAPGFNPVTLENTCYKIDGVFPEILDEHTGVEQQESQTFQISVWDTKGITAWDESIAKIIREHNPMCVILCSSPGSFAKDDFIRPLIRECVNLNVLVALACTNQWNDSDIKRQRVMEEFHDLLKVNSS
jgi:GTPase SAR1 family protein